MAHGLARLEVGRGDRVALMSHNVPEAVGVYYGVLKQSSVFTSLNPSYTPAEVALQVEHSTPRVVIAGPGMAERARAGVAGTRDKPRLVVMDGTPQPGEIGFSEMLNGVSGEMSEALVEENDLAMVMYTSGTESVPKGVMVTHRAMMISTTPSWSYERYVETTDVFLLLAPVYTMAGTGAVTNLISMGATLVMIPRTEPGGGPGGHRGRGSDQHLADADLLPPHGPPSRLRVARPLLPSPGSRVRRPHPLRGGVRAVTAGLPA